MGTSDPTGKSWSGTSLHVHVDDLTQVAWDVDQKALGKSATKAASKWLKVAKRLQVSISKKTCIVPMS